MKHLPFDSTPLEELNSYNRFNTDRLFFLKRDDYFLKAGGGSKARMLQYILSEVNNSTVDVIVTAGGPCSNFNRACALQCAQMGIKMHLIAYTEHEEEFFKSVNFFLCKVVGVTVTICKKTEVAQTISDVMSHYKELGIRAKNIYGGGRCLEGIYAYYDAVKELKTQIGNQSIDRIFVACGTGTTVSGIITGCQEYLPNTEVHAISVARRKDAEMYVIEENITLLNNYLDRHYDISNLKFHDEFIMGEYGATTPELINFIKRFISNTGVMVDPIYTGKALYGMHQILQNSTIIGTNLFWHTGAIFTLLSNQKILA